MSELNTMNLGFDLEAMMNKNKKFAKYKFEYLKEGTQVYRILPSFDPTNRRLEHKYTLHWLTGENGKSVKVLCTYSKERFCPVCQANKEAKEMLKAVSPGSDSAKYLAEADKKTQASTSVYYNAVNQAGEPVVLELNSTVSKLLEARIIEAVQKKNFDPTAPKGGCYFAFTKSGKGRDSVQVDFHRISKMVDGELMEQIDRSALSEELIQRLPTAVANIHDPKTLWLREYTSDDLNAYIKGERPLPNTNGRQAAAATSEDGEQSASDAVANYTETSTQAPAVTVAPTPAPAAASVPAAAGATSAQVTSATSHGGTPVSTLAEQAERLRRLASQPKTNGSS